MQRAYEELKDRGVAVLTISVDAEGASVVKPYLDQNGFTMPALLDQRLDLAHRLGLRGTPGTYIVDRQGSIVASGSGPVAFDDPDFRSYVLALASGDLASTGRW